MKTKIEWATDVWNPVTGCTKVSEGCRNCYAEGIAKRFWGERKFTDVRCHPDRLDAPRHWKKPRRVFVNSMSDLFHPDVPFEFIDRVFGAMTMACEHTFMILTKRPRMMLDWFNWTTHNKTGLWPLPNVWLGVTVENQKAANERIPLLLKTPAVVRFVSVEPMLGEVDMTQAMYGINPPGMNVFGFTDGFGYEACLDWVICGGETGPGARPMHPDWARSLRDQCQSAGVPFFFKQWGEYLDIDTAMVRELTTSYDSKYMPYTKVPGYELPFVRVGKKLAGRLLDGREWNEIPGVKE